MKQWSISSGPAATLLVSGDSDNPVPVLIQNVDPANTAYLGETNAVNPSNPRESVPLLPGQSSIATGDIDVYAIAAPGQNVEINTLRGFGSFFQPTNLTSLGGVGIYNTTIAPTQPPTIPLNSLWFTPAGGISQWNGSAWIPQTFSGQQVITANTITVNQLAAGIIYAGIVNGTLIQGATVRVVNNFGATIMTINKSAGTWIQYLDTGSVTQGIPSASSSTAPFTDEFNFSILAGTVTYALISGTIFAVQNLQGNINFVSAPNWLNTWNIYSSIEPDLASGSISYFDNVGNSYKVGSWSQRLAANFTVNSTSATQLPGMLFNVGPATYRITGMIRSIAAASGVAQPMTFSFHSTAGVSAMSIATNAYVEQGNTSTNPGIITALNANPSIITGNVPNNGIVQHVFDGYVSFNAAGNFGLFVNQVLSAADETFSVQAGNRTWWRLEQQA